LASDIVLYCGDLSCDWEQLDVIAEMLFVALLDIQETLWKDRKTSPENLFGSLLGTRNVSNLEHARKSVGKPSLRDFLLLCGTRKTTDPRDAIYSLLALAKDSNPNDWDVDYRKIVVDVVQDAIENIVYMAGSLDIICHSELNQEHEHMHS
jgi:hypothetical protein